MYSKEPIPCDVPLYRCNKCGYYKPRNEFCANKNYSSGIHGTCRSCMADNKAKRKANRLKLAAQGMSDEPAWKLCRSCGEEKVSWLFYPAVDNADWLSPECRDCTGKNCVAKRKARMAANPESRNKYRRSARRHVLKKKYGISESAYNSMNSACGGVCEICGRPESRKRTKCLAVDHCHKTGRIRGLLCSSCNIALGNFQDSAVVLENAIRYLNRPAKESSHA